MVEPMKTRDERGKLVVAYFGALEDDVIVRIRDDQPDEDLREPDEVVRTSTSRAIWTKRALADELEAPSFPHFHTFFQDVLGALLRRRARREFRLDVRRAPTELEVESLAAKLRSELDREKALNQVQN